MSNLTARVPSRHPHAPCSSELQTCFPGLTCGPKPVSPRPAHQPSPSAVPELRPHKEPQVETLLTLSPLTHVAQTSGNGKLEFDEFKVFWDKLKQWINLFLRFDADKSGTMSTYELRTALKAAGKDWDAGG
ncbi:hypothetical protein P7K49_035494 [Saguinus oedipus]|uniref:EF-hand domain-containing protein n=1 Tax=Saguinus oedipus TaxID=9490 RepID=A0ABQ9TMR6_SAGOE|nr:hypothetical protein P7K49_035494 [Saguinus oedipus]